MKYLYCIMVSVVCTASVRAQCEVVDCYSVDQVPIVVPHNDAETMTVADMVHVPICYKEEDIRDINYYNRVVRGVETWIHIRKTETNSRYIFISSDHVRDEGIPYYALYDVGGGCDELVQVYESSSDQSPGVLGFSDIGAGSFLVKVSVPLEDTTKTEGELTLKLYGVGDIPDCQMNPNQDANGLPIATDLWISTRSIGKEDDPFFPGERVTIAGTVFGGFFSGEENDSPVHSFLPLLGDGWVVSQEQLSEGFQVLSEAAQFIEEDDQCGIKTAIELPLYCYYEVDGYRRLCNMAVQDCPCSDQVSGGAHLGSGFTVTNFELCNTDLGCSVSAFGGSEEPLFIDVVLNLEVSTDPLRRDLSISILEVDEGTNGCADVSCHDLIPEVHGGTWRKLGPVEEYYGLEIVPTMRVCEGDVPVKVIAYNIGADTVDITFERTDDQMETISVYVESDTVVNLPFELADESISVRSIRVTGRSSGVSAFDVFVLYPPARASLIYTGPCTGECVDLQAVIEGLTPGGTTFSWSDGHLDIFNTYCQGDPPLYLYVDAGNCGKDTVKVPDIVDSPSFDVGFPAYYCNLPVGHRAISVSNIKGGIPPYRVDIFGLVQSPFFFVDDSTFSVDVNLSSDVFDFIVLVEDNSGCGITIDTFMANFSSGLLNVSPICQDGVPANGSPEVVLTIDQFAMDRPDVTIDEVDVIIDKAGLVGSFDEEYNYIISEEESESGSYEVVIVIIASDGCLYMLERTVVIVPQVRDFTATVVDFEVDFVPSTTVDLEEILWTFGDGTTSTEFFPTHIYQSTGTYEVTLRLVDHCGESEYTRSVFIGGTDVDDIDATSVQISPNPTTDSWTISVDERHLGDRIELYNVAGELMYSSTVQSKLTFVPCGEWPTGVYFLRVLTGQNQISLKLLKI